MSMKLYENCIGIICKLYRNYMKLYENYVKIV